MIDFIRASVFFGGYGGVQERGEIGFLLKTGQETVNGYWCWREMMVVVFLRNWTGVLMLKKA